MSGGGEASSSGMGIGMAGSFWPLDGSLVVFATGGGVGLMVGDIEELVFFFGLSDGVEDWPSGVIFSRRVFLTLVGGLGVTFGRG